jgi:hypothetical protein
MRDYELRTYHGIATLFTDQDEPRSNPEPGAAWSGKILGTCEIRFIPGTHQGILHRPQVEVLAREIRQKLEVELDGPAPWPESGSVQRRKQASLAFGSYKAASVNQNATHCCLSSLAAHVLRGFRPTSIQAGAVCSSGMPRRAHLRPPTRREQSRVAKS